MPKRQRGFQITVKGFIPMGGGIQEQIATLQLIEGITAGELGEAVEAMVGVEVTSKQTSRVQDAT